VPEGNLCFQREPARSQAEIKINEKKPKILVENPNLAQDNQHNYKSRWQQQDEPTQLHKPPSPQTTTNIWKERK
jgi:hypothetical protein